MKVQGIYLASDSESRERVASLAVPLFRCSSSFESLILSQHSRFTCECNKEEINDDDDDDDDVASLDKIKPIGFVFFHTGIKCPRPASSLGFR